MRTPGGNRTHGRRIKSPLLYRAELLAREGWQGRRDSNPRPLGPEPSALPSELLPIGAVNRSGWRDSNPRPPAPKAGALAKLRHIPVAAEAGVEPAANGVTTRCSAN